MNYVLLALTALLSCGTICGMAKTKVQLSEVEQSVVIACQSGQAQLVKFLLDAGADKDMLTPDGSTLMHVAIEQGHHEVVAVLVQAGADINREFNGMSPLYRASERGQYEIVELLIMGGADKAQSYQNLTPLLTATQKGHLRVVQLLMSNASQNLSLGTPARFASHITPEHALARVQVEGRKEVFAVSAVTNHRAVATSSSMLVSEGGSKLAQRSRGERPRELNQSAAASAGFSDKSSRAEPSASTSLDERRRHGVSKNDNLTKGNESFNTHKWRLALDYYKRALREVEIESENYYLILGNLMQIYHGDVHGVKAKPAKVLKYARILEVQTVHPGLQALSFVVLAECLYDGRGFAKDLTMALGYAQKAAQQSYNRVAQERGSLLVKKITEDRNNEAREREEKDREYINKITEENKRLELEARKASEVLLKERKEREAVEARFEQYLQAQAISAASSASGAPTVAAAAAAIQRESISSHSANAQSKSLFLVPRPFILQGQTDAISSVSMMPDGKWALTGSLDKTARLWDLRDTNAIRSYILRGHTEMITSVVLRLDGKMALTGSIDMTARLWDLRDTNNIRFLMLQGHTGPINAVALTPDGCWALTGSTDATARLWDLRSPNICSHILQEHADVSLISLADDAKWAITRSVLRSAEGRKACFWDLRDTSNIRSYPLKGHTDLITSVTLTLDGKWALTGSSDRTARLWDLRDVNNIRSYVLKGQSGSIKAVSLTPDCKWAITGSARCSDLGTKSIPGIAQFWDLRDTSNIRWYILEGREDEIRSVSLTPDGKWAIIGSYSMGSGSGGKPLIRLWDLRDTSNIRSTVLSYENPVAAATSGRYWGIGGATGLEALSSDGMWALTGSKSNAIDAKNVTLWDLSHYEDSWHSYEGSWHSS